MSAIYAAPLSAQGFYRQRHGVLSKTTLPAWQRKSSAPAGTESNRGEEKSKGSRKKGDGGQDRLDMRKGGIEKMRDTGKESDHKVKMETKIGGKKERQR